MYRRSLGACALAIGLASCASVEPPQCAPGSTPAASELLYFGTIESSPAGAVTEEQWATFLRDVVTPRFPDGLTVWRATGQWRAPDRSVVREGSYVLSIVHAQGAKADSALRAIIAEYKARFRQQSVLRVTTRACVSW